jgi:hypothetical protein
VTWGHPHTEAQYLFRASHERFAAALEAVRDGPKTTGGLDLRACPHPYDERRGYLRAKAENAYRASSVCLRNGRLLLNATKSKGGPRAFHLFAF